jgi:uncharacterized RDD family membrane protein YckC
MTQPSQHPPQDSYGQGGSQQYGSVGYGQQFGQSDSAEELAGRWRRLFAAIIDVLILSVFNALLSLPFVDYQTTDNRVSVSVYSSSGISVLVSFLYFWIMHATRGQTLGKMAMGIRVVRADDLDAITYGQAAWRHVFVYLISLVTCGIAGIVDVAWILWDKRRQALHDKIANTLVVKVDPNGPNPYARR